MDYPELTTLSSRLLVAFLIWVAYLTVITIYRLYFSPIAKFPGPKLAALTKWYEFYYDVVLQGQFTFQIQKMHREYGTEVTSPGLILTNSSVKVQLFA